MPYIINKTCFHFHNTYNQILKKAALITALYLLMPESTEALTDGTAGA